MVIKIKKAKDTKKRVIKTILDSKIIKLSRSKSLENEINLLEKSHIALGTNNDKKYEQLVL